MSILLLKPYYPISTKIKACIVPSENRVGGELQHEELRG